MASFVVEPHPVDNDATASKKFGTIMARSRGRRSNDSFARVVAAIAAATLTACAARSSDVPAAADRRCDAGPVDNYMAARWQRCWFESAHGRWRTINHEFHYDVLVAEVEATSADDAEAIARRWVDVHRERFQEILVYVRPTAGTSAMMRRVRWTATDGYRGMDF